MFDLELDDEVDLVLDELFCVADGSRAVVAVVEDEQVNADVSGSGFETLSDFNREGHLRALATKAEAKFPGARDVAIGAVGGLREIAAVNEGSKHPVNGGLGDPCLAMDGLQRHRLLLSLKEFEDVERLGEDGYEVEPFSALARCHVHLPGLAEDAPLSDRGSWFP